MLRPLPRPKGNKVRDRNCRETQRGAIRHWSKLVKRENVLLGIRLAAVTLLFVGGAVAILVN